MHGFPAPAIDLPALGLPLAQVTGSVVPPALLVGLCAAAAVGTLLLLPSPRREASVRTIGGIILSASAAIFALLLINIARAREQGQMGVYFWVFSAIALIGAIRVITHTKPVYSALYFVMTVLASAGLFVLLWAEFMAAALVLIYAGAILVLYLFVLMLLNLKTGEHYLHSSYPYFIGPAALGSLYVLFLLLQSPFDGVKGDAPATAILEGGDTYAVGIKMFSDHILQFEIVGIFLLGAIIGAIVLAKAPRTMGNAGSKR